MSLIYQEQLSTGMFSKQRFFEKQYLVVWNKIKCEKLAVQKYGYPCGFVDFNACNSM